LNFPTRTSYTNPQDLNRYSYVNNNPLRYNDPTGHMEVENKDMQKNHASMNCSKYPQYCSNGKKKSKEELAQMRSKKSTAQTTISGVPTTINPGQSSNGNGDFSSLSSYLQFMNNAYDIVDGLGRGTALLEKGFLWGKAVNPDPRFDFVLGALGQGLADLDNRNLTLQQRAARAGVTGLESVATGIASDLAGGIGFLAGEAVVPEGGGIVGFAILAVPTSVGIDTAWSNYNNQTLFKNPVFSSP
jgi:hypothetical protein